MSTYQNWLFTVDDHIATLTLNRPDQRNAITPETLFELRDLTRAIKEDADIWAVILEGAGDHFSVGVDVSIIGQMVGQDYETYRSNLYNLQLCLDEFEALPKPTIAKIRGFCIGGGIILSLCCDFRLAAYNAKFMLSEVKRGIAVIMGTQRITRTVGIAKTKEWSMLGDMFLAEEALQSGMLTKVVPHAELDAATAELAAKFRQLPPLTVGICKQIADQGQFMTLRESQDLEIRLQGALLGTADFQEGVASFFEKRPPVFQGK